MKQLKELTEIEALIERHAGEWPADVDAAARRLKANLTAAHTKSFQSSPVMVNGLATDAADFRAKFDAWRQNQR
jgi:hypothetical protein